MARIGFMLYSARRACAEDFEATLRAVAAMGYDGVEAFDLHGHDVVEVRGWLDELELDACGLHAPLVAVEADIASLAATARGLGTDRLVVSWVSPPTSAAEVADVRMHGSSRWPLPPPSSGSGSASTTTTRSSAASTVSRPCWSGCSRRRRSCSSSSTSGGRGGRASTR